MKKLQLFVVAFLISLSICLFASSPAVRAASAPNVTVPTLSPASPITLGGSVTATVIVGGASGTPTGTITFQYSTDGGITWKALGADKTLSKGSATSDSYTPTGVGSNYRIRAIYSGDSKFDGATGNAASLTVNKANPTSIVLTLKPTSPISLGGSTTAAATISGVLGVTPTGTVTFHYSTNSGLDWTQLGITKTLSSGSATSDSYTPTGVGSNYRIRAIYSGDSNYNTLENATLLTVSKANPTVPAPSVNPNPVVVNNTVTVSVNISGFLGGATPTGTATFQVKIGAGSWTTIGSAVSLSNSSASTTYVPTNVGNYQFQVIYSGDSEYNGAIGSAVSVTVNFAPLDHFVFSSIGPQAAGTPFSITIMAKDASNNTLTNYIGTSTLNVSTGTISPTTTGGFLNGVWSGSVNVTGADSAVTLLITGSGKSGVSNVFVVNPGALNSLTFATISSPQTAGSSFDITVTAKDRYGNKITGYVGSPSLTYSAGAISPGTIDAFINGVGSVSVTVAAPGSDVNITVTDGACIGVSNSFTVTNAPTPTPEPTTTPTSTSTSTPTQTSTAMSTPKPTNTPKPTATPSPSPSPTPIETIIKAKTDNGTIVDLVVRGNVTGLQISNAMISTNQSALSTTVFLTMTGKSGTTGFSSITIPKTALLNEKNPVVFIDDKEAANQGFSEDTENFYVWFTTQFSTHQIKIMFSLPLTSQESSFGTLLAVGVIIPEIVAVYIVVAVKRLRRRPENT